MSTPRYFCLRFDVDTPLCVRRGIPNLLRLAEKNQAQFTFFVTPGRSIARLATAANLLRRRRRDGGHSSRSHVGTWEKLGPLELGRLLALNPRLLPQGANMLRSAAAAGHEIGLHGGHNHALWQHGAHTWSELRLAREIDYGHTMLVKAMAKTPTSFASPGWNSPPELPSLLNQRGFEILADEHGAAGTPHRIPGTNIISSPTWLTGEPGGVGYIEWHRARGTPTETIVSEIRQYLDAGPDLVCLYDHPFFAGIRELYLLERILEAARASGRVPVPIDTAAKELLNREPARNQ